MHVPLKVTMMVCEYLGLRRYDWSTGSLQVNTKTQDLSSYLDFFAEIHKAENDFDLCLAAAREWVKGKRSFTLPGHEERIEVQNRVGKLLEDTPQELLTAVDVVLESEKGKNAIRKYSNNPKVINSLIGDVLKIYKTEPRVVLELLKNKLDV